MIEACVFDIGGTLIKTEDALLEAIKQSFLKNNLTPPPDDEILLHCGIGHLNIFRKLIPTTRRADAGSLIKSCYLHFKSTYPQNFMDEFRLFPNVELCLTKLKEKKIKTACQTGMGSKEARMLLQHFNLLSYFPVLVAFEDAPKPRPHPDAMYLTMKRLGISDKTKILYIGDTITDIKFAKNSGVRIACVTTGPQPKEILLKEKPDYLIDNLMELLDLV